ncbi:MAG: FAD-binding protein [Bacteriovoracaceae bacterium]|nr:FAD-binding protein [Bacteriovoracaceae bacterium]
MSEIISADVAIIGTGVAGLSAAHRAIELGLNIVLITRSPDPTECNTKYAQGGIVYSTPEDQKLVDDILKASSGTSNIQTAEFVSKYSGKIVENLLLKKAQVPFAKDEAGEFQLAMEGAHSFPRILFAGDYSGRAIEESLLDCLTNLSGPITILKDHTAIDLELGDDRKVSGIHLLDNQNSKAVTINCSSVILATGGVASLYLHNSNTSGARGDGHAIAARAGAELNDMEFVQFHPTTFYDPTSHKRFLISEAVRGEGAILRNCNGERFMERYHPDLELASRDIVSKSIVDEMERTNHPCVYLDISHLDSKWFKKRFPTIASHCERSLVDLANKGIPVVPSAHYTCGGIVANLDAETSVEGLYAVGECSYTGLHGANRLASTALLEGLTFGWFAAEKVAAKNITAGPILPYSFGAGESGDETVNNDMWARLKSLMWDKVGIVRNKSQLLEAQSELLNLQSEVNRRLKSEMLTDELLGLRNAMATGLKIVEGSKKRHKSIGCFNLN